MKHINNFLRKWGFVMDLVIVLNQDIRANVEKTGSRNAYDMVNKTQIKSDIKRIRRELIKLMEYMEYEK